MIQNEDQMMFELKLKASDLDEADISVNTLYNIYTDYLQNRSLMEQQAEHFARILNHCSEVNSVKWRAKDPIHLIHKIIRKKKKPDDNPKYANIDVSNYKEIVTDLIGLRAIFIFKAHWSLVDEYIFKKLHVCPDNTITIYHASDDDLTFFPNDSSVKKDGEVTYNYKLEKKESRYRSTHYTLQGEKHTGCKVELQVRSILDEAWGEIDHHIRYPDNEDDPELLRKMSILNGQISGCEEHASQSYVYFTELEATKPESIAILENKNTLFDLVEDTSKIEGDVEDAENAKSSVAINDTSIKTFQNIDHMLRLSKILKSTQPQRSFEGFDQTKYFNQMEAMSRALGSGSIAARFSEIVDQALIKDLYSNSVFSQAEAISRALDSGSVAVRFSEIANQASIKNPYPDSVFSQAEAIRRALGNEKNDDDDDDILDNEENNDED